jgi:DNA replication protein DnaC
MPRWCRQNIERLLRKSGVLPRYISCSLENFKGKLPQNRPTFICGPPGTGKTHLAVGYLREEIIRQGTAPPLFVRAVDLFREIRGTFRDGSYLTEAELLETYGRAVPFLVLDDLGSEKVTDFVLQTLYEILDRRYGEYQETLITSNLSLEELAGHYESHGDRLASRIAGMGTVMVLKGKDRRLHE